MESKINAAASYVRDHIVPGADETAVKNDAANIFAANYGEYLEIWEALKNI